MAATEGLQIGTVIIKYDPENIKRENFTDAITRLLFRVDFSRKSTGEAICTVIVGVASIDWKNGAFPPANRISQVQGLTSMEIQ